jgi:hypothetical protein
MRRDFYIRISVFICIVFGFAVAGIRLSGQTASADAERFEAGAGVHETHARWESSFQLPQTSERSPQPERVAPPPPTRGSFMASWQPVSGAKGYLLDVSTSNTFDSYVDGYHDLDVGDATGRVVTGLNRGTTYYYRVRAHDVTGIAAYTETTASTTEPSTGLTIHATFDSSITNNSNAAAIEAMITRAISLHESLFSDPIAIQIRFRYSTTTPDGTPLPMGTLARTDLVTYQISWSTYINALRADATTSNDTQANASLPGTTLSPNVQPSGAAGRAVGLNTPPTMFADGTVGQGGPYDAIVTLNSSVPYQFSRPPSASSFDAQRSTEHEVDEAIGLGSHLGGNGSDLWPQDLFSWSSAGDRNITTSGTRYFSINGGVTNIVNFSQDTNGDLGDWLSGDCPQTHPYVQNAFACAGQYSDISATSPEGINLDVVGYDLVQAPPPTPTPTPAARAIVADFNRDSTPDLLVQRTIPHQTAALYLNNDVVIGAAWGLTLPAGWSFGGAADFDGDGNTDEVVFNFATGQTALIYLSGMTVVGAAFGPSLSPGWELVGTGDFNGDGHPDYVLYKPSTGETAIWHLNNNVFLSATTGPPLPSGWNLVGVADFNSDGHPDFALYDSVTGETVIGYLSDGMVIGAAFGPTIPVNWPLVATADFSQDGHPDYLLYNPVSGQTAMAYLNDTILVGAALGPTLPAGWGWSLIGQ